VATVQLDPDQVFSSDGFTVAADGNGGTIPTEDVIPPRIVSATYASGITLTVPFTTITSTGSVTARSSSDVVIGGTTAGSIHLPRDRNRRDGRSPGRVCGPIRDSAISAAVSVSRSSEWQKPSGKDRGRPGCSVHRGSGDGVDDHARGVGWPARGAGSPRQRFLGIGGARCGRPGQFHQRHDPPAGAV
jgi:hypothetical protein